jgi:hypothetical protein
MIAERLEAGKIVFGLKGDLSGVINTLCDRSTIPELAAQFRAQKPDDNNERFSYIGDGIAVPHLRIDNLPAPELILSTAPSAIPPKARWFAWPKRPACAASTNACTSIPSSRSANG